MKITVELCAFVGEITNGFPYLASIVEDHAESERALLSYIDLAYASHTSEPDRPR